MTKIYEALRQHEQRQGGAGEPGVRGHVGPARPAPESLVPQANQEMQVLYRSIETSLGKGPGGKIVLFSSARPGEGKSTVVGEFAVTLASTIGLSVLVLDADKKHVLSSRFAPGPALALDHVLAALEGGAVPVPGSIAAVALDTALFATRSNKLGPLLPTETIEKLKHFFDYILVDCPSLAAAPWSLALARQTDGVILVIEAERTRWPVVRNAQSEFQNADAAMLGAFLNRRRFYIPKMIYERL
jgi:Mrp family chromosome partitioning ATPase